MLIPAVKKRAIGMTDIQGYLADRFEHEGTVYYRWFPLDGRLLDCGLTMCSGEWLTERLLRW